MFPLDYIDPYVFTVALCIGLLFVYTTTPAPEIIIKYPTPHNAGKITYVDEAGVCYKYKVTDAACPADQSDIKKMPLVQN